MVFTIPSGLTRALQEGRCVAFVGAGFARPLMPSWHELLTTLAVMTGDEEVATWLRNPKLSNRDYEGIAQALKARTPKDQSFEALLLRALDPDHRPGVEPSELVRRRMLFEERLRKLRAIPFHSILTTNFDPLIAGETPSREVFARVIRSKRRPWWSYAAWAEAPEGPRFDASWRAPVVKLHGDLGAPDPANRKLAFTTRDYRTLVHEQPGYRAFLRTLFATHAVLYMGFSFTDGYINELRSEILSWVGSDRPLDYAIMADVPSLVADHLEQHESLRCLRFESKGGDFSGFDAWLDAIYAETAPEATLRARVSGKRILWFDPEPKNNQLGHRALRSSQDGVGGAALVVTPTRCEDAIGHLGSDAEPFDLVISHFGYRPDGPSSFERFMTAMRRLPLTRQAPVVVFSQREHRHENRPIVLRLGAFDYVDTWSDLFEAIERIFEPPQGDPPSTIDLAV